MKPTPDSMTQSIDIENVLDFFQDLIRPKTTAPLLFTRRIGWSGDGKVAEGQSINRAPLQVGGRAFSEGWGDHAQSELELRFPSPAEAFEVLVGVQDLLRGNEPLATAARIVFTIEDVDGNALAASPELHVGDAPHALRAALGGARRVFLRARDLRFPADTLECPGFAHAAWCEPVVTLADGTTLRQADFEVLGSAPLISMACCRYNGRIFNFDEPGTIEHVESTPSLDRYRLEQTTPDGLLTIRVTATVYHDFPVIEWLPELLNRSDRPSAIVEDFRPLSLNLPLVDYSHRYVPCSLGLPMRYPIRDVVLRRTLGSKCLQSDFETEAVRLRERFPANRVHMEPDEGRSSAVWLPYFGLDFRADRGINIAIGWTGRWYADFEHLQVGFRLECGMPRTHFRVLPGETLRQPSIVLHHRKDLSVEEGQNQFRRFALAYHSPRKADGSLVRTPLPLSAWGGADDKSLLSLIAKAVEERLPYDMFWVDAGWFGTDRPVARDEFEGSDWWRTVGLWHVNRVVHPDGFRPVAAATRKAGMRFLLWFEIERAMIGTPVTEQHRDYFYPAPVGGGDSLLLDLGNPGARAWAVEQVDRLIREHGITDYRQDFNCDPAPVWDANDAPDRVGVSEMRHIAGLYAFWDELRRRHPDMLIDNCASGGRRIDIETNSRSICLFRSDMLGRPWYDCSDANQVMVSSLAQWVPLHSGGATPVEGDDYSILSGVSTGVDTPIARFAESPGYFDWARSIMAAVRRMMECFYGDFFLLTQHPETRRGLYAYQCDLPAEGRGFFIAFQRGGDPEDTERNFTLRAIVPDADYEVETFRGTTNRMKGADLRCLSVFLPEARQTRLVFYKKL
ncbi:MAG: hypothetical protein GX174_12525 [Lentisphaerae bacterium]|jgi:alpha-galactosidase|nr:hypothetical protein [Lentisphaerota bacterium]